MASHGLKNYKKSEKYKGVFYYENSDNSYWAFKIIINHNIYTKTYKSEKEAAIAYDMKLIDFGKEPVNVLKRK